MRGETPESTKPSSFVQSVVCFFVLALVPAASPSVLQQLYTCTQDPPRAEDKQRKINHVNPTEADPMPCGNSRRLDMHWTGAGVCRPCVRRQGDAKHSAARSCHRLRSLHPCHSLGVAIQARRFRCPRRAGSAAGVHGPRLVVRPLGVVVRRGVPDELRIQAGWCW